MKKGVRICATIIVLALTFALNQLNAQDKNYSPKQFSIDNGLSQNTVHTILKDKRGFIWVGTQDGVNRYDGVGVSVIKEGSNRETDLINGTVTKMVEDVSRNKLYISTNGGGLSVFDYNTEKLKHFTYSNDSGSIISDYLFDIALDNKGMLWVAASHGLCQFNPDSEVFKNYEYQKDNEYSIPNTTITSLVINSANDIWLGTYGRGIVKFDRANERFYSFYNTLFEEQSGNSNIISRIAEDYNGDILIASDDGLHRFCMKDSTYEFIGFRNTIVKSIAKGVENDLWIGTSGSGIRNVNSKGIITEYNFGSESFVPDDFIIDLFVDDRNHMWIGTKSSGLFHVNLDGEKFQHITEGTDDNGIVGRSVYALAEGTNNEIWIGTNVGLTCWNSRLNSYKSVFINGEGVDFSVWALYFEKPNYLWIGTSTGLYKYNTTTASKVHYTYSEQNKSGIPDKEIYAIARDKLNRIWIGTAMGLARLDDDSGVFTRYYYGPNENDICSSVIWDVFSDSQGRFWISTYGGLNVYNFKSDDFTSLYHYKDDSTSLSSNYINSVHEDEKGRILVSTGSGANMLDDTLNVVLRIDASNGLNNAHVYQTLEHDNKLWISTNNGLSCFNIESEEVVNYDVHDGIQSNEFNNAGLRLKDGRFAFGGINGVTIFDPEKIERSDFEPPLYFTTMQLYDNSITIQDTARWHDGVIKKTIINTDRIEFDSNERFFRLDFAALDYSNPVQIDYYYRMLPNSESWIPLGKQRHLTFINLAPDTYTLEIRSTNSDRVLCNNTKSLTIEVHPPWWLEPWFIVLVSVIVLFVVVYFIRYRIRKLGAAKQELEKLVINRTREIEIQRNIANKHRDEIAFQKSQLEDFAKDLEEKVMERTQELEKSKVAAEESDRLKTAFLSNMSHEIRTPMNAIIGFSELLLDANFDAEERMDFAKMIKSNGDELLNLLNDIIDISMIESSQLKISLSDVVVGDLIEQVYSSFLKSNDLTGKHKLEFRLEKPAMNLTINSDAFRLKQILNNLISNALKFTKEGHVELGFFTKDKNVYFYVEDTGVGVDRAYQKQIFERFLKVKNDVTNLNRGNGLGLTITKNLVQLLNGSIELYSEEGKGSRFTFKLPL
ncbi:two-component regulator propeller domain-containing protein [Carboxylicivirga sp. N1Y90]|uniref:two-component regulator propeller domain-containing protein n=1 Tax=Carboxylicivirga fragile TaxID=3417571 RepID=UPI003D33BE17|nr:hypothetical protein [Marinilabiliaceae bacterium N1Y90]